MAKTEREVFDIVLEEIRVAVFNSDIEALADSLGRLFTELPDGEAKNFFQELKQSVAEPLAQLMAEEGDWEMLNEAIELLTAARAKFDGGFPVSIPLEIIETYGAFLDELLMGFEFLRFLYPT